MKLYYAPGACSLAVHSALYEVGAAFETIPLVQLPLTDYPHLRSYLARVSARTRVRKALASEGLST